MVGQEINDVKIAVAFKVAAFILGGGLVAIAIQKFAAFSIRSPRDFFLTIYYLIFGIMVIASELSYEKIRVPFNFIGYYLGKSAFLFFVATIIFDQHL